MPKQTEPYTCPRCGYYTIQKPSMRKHLYINKKVCPMNISNIELTDQVKQTIIDYRIYRPSLEDQQKNVTNITNITNNTMNNFLSNIPIQDRLNVLMTHKNLKLTPFEESIEDKFASIVEKLDNTSTLNDSFSLSQQDFLEIIDRISRVCNGEKLVDMNLLYNKELNKLCLYDEGVWDEMLVQSGLVKILKYIQAYFLNNYECYLLRCIFSGENTSIRVQKSKELIFEYYKFLAYFCIEPYVKGRPNNEILVNESDDRFFLKDNDYSIEEQYMPYYINIRDKQISRSDVNNVKKEMIDIIKRNTKKNISELNMKITQLFKMDDGFKQSVLYAFDN